MLYGDADRKYAADHLPVEIQSLLDVGSGSGKFVADLKLKLPHVEAWAIDPEQNCSTRLGVDRFISGRYPDDLPPRRFDVVVFNDVLEHMVDPWKVLRDTLMFLNSNDRVIASIPNVRNYAVIKPLLINGTFDYQDAGLLDRTRLRFFYNRRA